MKWQRRAVFISELPGKLKELEALYASIEVTAELTVRVSETVSLGETMMAKLMNLALRSESLSSCFGDSSQVISLSDENEGLNQLKMTVSKTVKIKIVQFKDHNVVVVQGFIGSTSDSKVMTHHQGRGGSDYTQLLYMPTTYQQIKLRYIKK